MDNDLIAVVGEWFAMSAPTNLSVRNIDVRVRDALRLRAARNARSMESEVRHIIEDATRDMADFEGCGVDLIDPWQT